MCETTKYESDETLGRNPVMQRIQSLLGRVGGSSAPVLINGETGAGKEVVARAVHANSPRATKIFLKLNCAALPAELVESELFGYERGAFTGAHQRKAGMFEMANGGTLLLDEIGDMDVKLQAKLLQVLQDQQFQRVGGGETVQVDVRIIAATHRDLPEWIRSGRFREDLYYRLNVLHIRIPPLRERKEDILPLAERLLRKHGGDAPLAPLTPALEQAMLEYDWPGNVRELENLMFRYVVLRDAADLLRELRERQARRGGGAAPDHAPVSREDAAEERHSALGEVAKANREAEAAVIFDALNQARWNRKRAAQALGIDYKALLYKMSKLGIGAGAA